MKIEPILLTTLRVQTYLGRLGLTNATGFFFERDDHLFLVTSRHVVIDPSSGHFPDRLEIELHVGEEPRTEVCNLSIPLYREGMGVWRTCKDHAGDVDVAMLEINRAALPAETVYYAFTPEHLPPRLEDIEVGTPLLVVGFPLGFHDNLHHLPVVRQAVIASSFGLRFQGKGYFLTDGRMHRGTSGAPVVMRMTQLESGEHILPWMLLGVHSARLDIGTRDLRLDEALGLNCAWYADVLMTLSVPREQTLTS